MPWPAPLRTQGVRAHEQGLQAHCGRQAHARLPAPAAGKGPEGAQAPQEDRRNAGRLAPPPHAEEMQGGAREAQPAPRRAGVRMPGQEVQQKLAHGDGFGHKSYAGERITTALGYRGRAAGSRTTQPTPQASAAAGSPPVPVRVAQRLPAPCRPPPTCPISLDCHPSEAMPTGGAIAGMAGRGARDLHDRVRGGARAGGIPDRAQEGVPRRQGSARTGILVRGGVPSTAGSGGAQNFASARKSEMRENGEGKKPMRVRHIRLAGGRSPNTKERSNGTIRYPVR